jgi:glycogen debranching enzyme
MDPGLVRLRVRDQARFAGHGDTVLAIQRNGYIDGGPDQGLFVHETRLLSLYRCTIGRHVPLPVVLCNVRQDSWLGYYIVPVPGDEQEEDSFAQKAAQNTIELRVSRVVGEGMHEDLDVVNYSQKAATFRLGFEIDADFADMEETRGERRQQGRIERRWRRYGDVQELAFDYRAENDYHHQDVRGHAHVHRSLTLRINCTDTRAFRRGRRLWFDIALEPHGRWHACFDWIASINDEPLPSPGCRALDTLNERPRQPGAAFLRRSTRFASPESDTLTPVVIDTLEQARRDLSALRLQRLDHGDDAWVPAAGLPMFIALFGRDSLTAAQQGVMLGPEMLKGTLACLAETQGRQDIAWRDEQPGRILHEAHTGPLGALNIVPKGRDYFSLSSSGLYPFAVAQLWQWTGDRDAVAPLIEPALKALHWLDSRATADHRGFYASTTRSRQGIANQSWKDSDDAIVHEDGSQVPQPVATCEEQGIVYSAKLAFAEVLWCFDRKDEAQQLLRQATELKRRFNDAYWMEDLGFLAMGLDPCQRQVRSLGSNALHCLAAGIVDEALAPRVMERLFAEDLYTGWGIRTLSAAHPAYNPYAYHRGTVWPIEHGPFAIGAYRYGCNDRVEQICRGLFDAAACFEYRRLPECFAGHPRDADHPFPSLYPAANSPQAWSASTVVTLLQSLLGVQAYAPFNLLLVDPHLPGWLPEITVRGLRVGEASVDLRFFRDSEGRSRHEVLDRSGPLEVRQQSSPWALTGQVGAALRERLG